VSPPIGQMVLPIGLLLANGPCVPSGDARFVP
jgi:hypothetical protein